MACFTSILWPRNSLPCSCSMAALASASFSNWTKANPLRTMTPATAPCAANRSFTASLAASRGRLPTNTLGEVGLGGVRLGEVG